MKTILVPIDFTAASENALLYANKLAGRLPAHIVLALGGAGEELAPAERTVRLRRLETLAESLRYKEVGRQSGSRIHYSFHVSGVALPQMLPQLVDVYQACLIVTGLEDCAAHTAAGNANSLLPERLKCPVLVVPPGHQELPTYVVIAGDFAHFQARQLAWLPTLARTPGAHFDLLQLRPATSAELVSLKKALMAAHASLPSAGVNLLPTEDGLEGMSGFCAQQSAELLVLATPDGDLLRRFFDPHGTRSNPYHLCIPVLLLPSSASPQEMNTCEVSQQQVTDTQLADVSLETL